MAQSILNSIKKKLGLDPSYDVFDFDIMTSINSAFSTLQQLGVGPASGFRIEDEGATWDAFIGNHPVLSSVIDYVYLKVRVVFDPPGTSFVLSSIEKQIAELEFRLMIHAEDLPVVAPPVVVPTPEPEEPTEIDGGGADSW